MHHTPKTCGAARRCWAQSLHGEAAERLIQCTACLWLCIPRHTAAEVLDALCTVSSHQTVLSVFSPVLAGTNQGASPDVMNSFKPSPGPLYPTAAGTAKTGADAKEQRTSPGSSESDTERSELLLPIQAPCCMNPPSCFQLLKGCVCSAHQSAINVSVCLFHVIDDSQQCAST